MRGPLIMSALAIVLTAGAGYGQVAVRGETIHTMTGAPLRNGVVLIGANGRIERVGPASDVAIPTGYRTFDARVVTPGLIDAHTVIGVAGYLNQPHDQDQLDRTNAIQPALRAVDAYNAREELVAFVRKYGVTTLHTGHGPGALVSGQTMVVKTRGESVEAALVDSLAMLAMTLGPEVSQNYGGKPGTRAKGMALLRAQFLKAQDYTRKRKNADLTKRPDRDLDLEMLSLVLDGEVPAMITAQHASEIMSALRLQEEFGFKLVLDGAAESYLLIDEIKRANVPVILHPTMARHSGQLANATFQTAKQLKDAGVTVALQSGFESYVPKTRVVLFEAAMASSYGLTFDQALATVTVDAARVLGLEARIGSIAAGKDGDLALFDGDPFEYTSHVCAVIISGQVVSETCN